MKFLFVFLGSGIGGVIRYAISFTFSSTSLKFPWPTFMANLVAAFLVGLFYSIAAQKTWFDKNYLLLLTTGLCGGLSTFSAFSYETLRLWQAQQYGISITYVVLSILSCLLFAFIGSKLA